jgi:hypothetical protein
MARLLAGVLLCAVLFGGGYWRGQSITDRVWLDKEAASQKKQKEQEQEAFNRANAAAVNYVETNRTLEQRYAELETKYRALRRTPLVVSAAPVACKPQPSNPAPASEGMAGVVPPVLLTIGAVRMWNGALDGIDHSVGACDAADATPEASTACAQSAGLTLDDAWENHRINSKSCAEDRLRYQQLIDFLRVNNATTTE